MLEGLYGGVTPAEKKRNKTSQLEKQFKKQEELLLPQKVKSTFRPHNMAGYEGLSYARLAQPLHRHGRNERAFNSTHVPPASLNSWKELTVMEACASSGEFPGDRTSIS